MMRHWDFTDYCNAGLLTAGLAFIFTAAGAPSWEGIAWMIETLAN